MQLIDCGKGCGKNTIMTVAYNWLMVAKVKSCLLLADGTPGALPVLLTKPQETLENGSVTIATGRR